MAVPDMVLEVVEGVVRVFPVRDQAGDVLVHGHERIFVHGPAGEGEVPPSRLVGEAEVPEVQGLGGGDDEVVSDARVLVDVPL
jgi:hypothetical protein